MKHRIPEHQLPPNEVGGHCAVANCTNQLGQEAFVGTMCFPCFQYAMGTLGTGSTMERNAVQHALAPRREDGALLGPDEIT